MNKYRNITDRNVLLNKLLKEHEELNYLSEHNHSGDDFDLDNLDKKKLIK